MAMQPEAHDPAPVVGWNVYSLEGLPLGRIDDLRGGYMHIDVPRRRDYWLSLIDIVSTEGNAVTLGYPAEALDQHKFEEPPETDIYAARERVAEQILLGEDEQRAQRELIERELAEQRARLREQPRGAPGGTVGEPVERELERMEGEDRAATQPAAEAPSLASEERAASAGIRRYMPYVLGAVALSLVLMGIARRRRRRRMTQTTPASSITSPAAPSRAAS
jgi:hypothetical protein